MRTGGGAYKCNNMRGTLDVQILSLPNHERVHSPQEIDAMY
jgi:hypothetical protein